ncbi:hypothetical protein CSOJ01_10340 [Colletotrichum sojae]|uniref:Secreted protein n=1 Tax=Colletotrichum sojae TaxID=2175907 RepID=A0A8H6J0U0_9PEZI|nr:hypothetical protein CSOJ01_10340 [Colletotrichum sojae]
MHLSVPVTLALAAVVSACYGDGQAWGGSINSARLAADNVCREWDGVTFAGGENKYACRNLEGNVRVDFRLRNGDNGGPSRRLDFATCVSGLLSQINNCNFGGENNQGAWRPRSDPNVGRC